MSSEWNKDKLIVPPPILTRDQQDCVDILEEALKEARAGLFSSVAIVMCKKNGFASALTGRQAADLNLACDELKARILEGVRRPMAATAASILRSKLS